MPISFDCPHCGAHTDVPDEYAGQTGPCAQCGATVTMPGAGVGPSGTSGRSSKPLLWVLLAVGVAGMCCIGPILVALLLPAVSGAREAARRAQCTNNLKQIALAMHVYNEAHGTFPPAYLADDQGQPMHSWRVLILPYLDQQALYDQYDFDEPWNGPNNSRLAAMMPGIYTCPSSNAGAPATDYVVITGPGTLFDGTQAVTPGGIKDGASNTILVVESSNAGVHWMEPTDFHIDGMSFQINDVSAPSISSNHPGGAIVGMADSAVLFVDEGTNPEIVRAQITADGGELIQFDF